MFVMPYYYLLLTFVTIGNFTVNIGYDNFKLKTVAIRANFLFAKIKMPN